jgi:5'-nucleotidase
MVTTLKAEGAQVIVTLAHIGDEGEFTTKMLAEQVAGIDVIIDGHSHSTYPDGKLVGTTLIVAAGEKTKNVGVVELAVKNGMVDSKKATLFTKDASLALTDDEAMTAVVATIKAENDIITEEVVATTPVLLVGEKPLVRTGETNLGNLLAESLLDISKADVSFTNGGGIRSSIDVGEVTKGDVLTVLPYGNTVRVIELTGADIWAVIENGVDEYPAAKGAFPHIAGMTAKFDSTKEAGKRVTEIKIAGEMIDLTKTYTMATNDFLVAGGDGYKMLVGKKVVAEFGAMDEVLIDYMNTMGFDKAVEDDRIMDINDVVSFIINLFAA